MNHSAVLVVLTCVLANEICGHQHHIDYKDVAIDTGVVRGYKAEDGEYLAFLGMPYAAPPVGNLRFKAPLPPPPWSNIFHAKRTVKCPQDGEGEEDCLILNVFSPTKIFNEPLPVLVYIHGGAYVIGSGQTHGAEPLVKENVIVVTINYRLGALGFLCLGVEEAPGNAGLKDQVAALKWVQRNIGRFGGDPNQVTVYGMSAGGASVDLLIMSRLAKGLFRNAIIESGTATVVWSVDANPVQTAFDFAKSFDIHQQNLYKILDFYRTIPVKRLSTANYELYQNLTDGTFGFAPCVEKKVFGISPFITQSPLNIIKKKIYNKVPMMFIFANLEGLYLRSTDYYELNYKDRMNRDFKDFMLADLVFDTEEIRYEITNNVKAFYFGNKTIGDNTLLEYLDYFGDGYVLHGILNSAVNYAKDNIDVYLMEFAYKGQMGTYEKFYEHIKMAGHGDAVKYNILNKAVKSETDKKAVNEMAKIVANFVKYSNPIPTRTDLLPIHWPAIHPNNVTYLRFDNSFQVLEEPYWERKIFWDRLYGAYRKDIKPVDTGLL